MINAFFSVGLLLLTLLPQTSYTDKVKLKNKAETISCRIIKETFKDVQYWVNYSGQVQLQTVPVENVENLEYDPAALPHNYAMGLSNLKNGNYAAAIDYFEKSIGEHKDVKPELQYCHYYKAEALLRQGKIDEAMKEYDNLLKAVPDTKFIKDIFINKFNVYLRSNNIKMVAEAVSGFESAASRCKMASWQDEIDMLKAQLYVRQQKWNDAQQIYAKYENDNDPEVSGPAIIGVLNCLRQKKDVNTLKSKADGAIKRTKSDRVLTAAYNGIGDYYLSQSKNGEAMLAYLRGVVLYTSDATPEHEYALYGTVVAMSKYAAAFKGEQKDLYAKRASDNFFTLSGRYPSSPYVAEAKKALESIPK